MECSFFLACVRTDTPRVRPPHQVCVFVVKNTLMVRLYEMFMYESRGSFPCFPHRFTHYLDILFSWLYTCSTIATNLARSIFMWNRFCVWVGCWWFSFGVCVYFLSPACWRVVRRRDDMLMRRRARRQVVKTSCIFIVICLGVYRVGCRVCEKVDI